MARRRVRADPITPARGPVAYADETGHRTAGRNGWLWTVGDGARHTLCHVDKGRSGKVIRGLLGESCGGTMVCDFYGGHDERRCRKQRCGRCGRRWSSARSSAAAGSTAGADAWATVASICRTARQQGRDVLGTLKTLIERSWSGQETRNPLKRITADGKQSHATNVK